MSQSALPMMVWPSTYLDPWFDAQRTLLETLHEAPQVIAMRLMWLATPPFLWSGTQQEECVRMVAEKHDALNDGMLAMSDMLGRGMMDPLNSSTLPARLLSAGLEPAHSQVRSNLARLEQRQNMPQAATWS